MLAYEQVLERHRAAKANKQLWENHIRECYEYAMPVRNTIDKFSKGAKKRNRVFDSTAESSLEDFANRMTALLVPNTTQWMKLEAGSEIPKEEADQVNKYLEETTDTLFKHINSSNFTSQINESFLDLGISTGAIIVEEGDGIQSGLNFRAISLSELYPERSSKGIIETVYRDFKIPVKDITSTWEAAELTTDLKKILEKNPVQEISLTEGVVQNGDKWEFILLHHKEKTFLMQQELDYNPYIVFRESSIPGETLGRGRVMRCLNDIKTLNRMVEDYLKGLSFQANPMWTAMDDGVINPHITQVRPGNVVAVGSENSLKPLQPGGSPQLLDFAITKLQDNIKQVMLSKPFGNIQDTPVRTATEMSIRNADLAQTSLSSSTRIQSELLERIIANSIYILKKAGKVPDFKINGKEVGLKFVNPASRQQKESDLAAYGRLMEMAQALPPELVMQKIKVEDIPVNIVDALGLPESIKRDEMEQQQFAQQQQQAEQRQMQMQQGGQQV